jgi:hypothetical protein
LLGENYQINPNLVDHPYFYYLGLDASENIDPLKLGAYRYYRGWSESTNDINIEEDSSIEENTLMKSWSSEQEKLFDELQGLFKKENFENFFQYVHEHHSELNQLIDSNKVGLNRLDQLFLMKNFKSLALSPESDDSSVTYFKNLILLKMVDIELNQKQKLNLFLDEFNKLTAFHKKNSSVEIIIISSYIDRYIDVIRFQQLKEKQKNGIQLELFNQQQLSTKSTLKDTAVMLYLTSNYAMSKLPQNIRPLIYLPNKTINQVTKDMEIYLKLSELPYVEYKKQLTTIEPNKHSEYALKNYVGNMLVQISQPNYINFSMYNHLINNKIIVFNTLNQELVDVDTLNQNKQGYDFYKTKTELCIKNPHPNPSALEHQRLSQNSCVKI